MKQYRFRRWLRNWITNFDKDEPETAKIGRLSVVANDDPDNEKSLQFRVWFATGGKVIQTNRYDRVKDRHFTSMYVVTDNDELGREIDKIITMESLR